MLRTIPVHILCIMALSVIYFLPNLQAQDAAALEAQYKTCAKHYIPADKCTPEIYQQLQNKDNAPLDPVTATAFQAVKEYQTKMKNPASIQVHTAYVTDEGAVCLEIAGQNGMGGMSVSRVVYLTQAWPHRGKGKWLDEGGMLGAMAANQSGTYEVDRWGGYCYKLKSFGRQGDMYPGVDVTDRVNEALKEGR